MAKFFGVIGFAEMVETAPGVHTEQITERSYYGDVIRNSRRLQATDQLNDDITVSIELSIVADPYVRNHFHTLRYAEYNNAKWKITNVTEQYPRLVLSLGGVYNGNQT